MSSLESASVALLISLHTTLKQGHIILCNE